MRQEDRKNPACGKGRPMKHAILFALALVSIGCSEPSPRNLDDLVKQNSLYLDPDTQEPFSGPVFRVSPNDPAQIVLTVDLLNGRLHGDFEDFDPTGVEQGLGLYATGTYLNGRREGRYEYFYPSGVRRGRGTYRDDRPDGPYESYYENGRLRLKHVYKGGKPDGAFETYRENGTLEWTGTYKDGERHGPFEGYYENGRLQLKGTYENGTLHRLFERYYPDGEITVRGIYNLDVRCGEWIEVTRTVNYPPCPPTSKKEGTQ